MSKEKYSLNYESAYKEMFPFMKDEELPEELNLFCEFIIQQNAKDANDYFMKHPEIAEAFLEYFEASEEVFFRGGYENEERFIVSASTDKSVAVNFACLGSNSPHYSKPPEKCSRVVMEMIAERVYYTNFQVDNEKEVFLWNASVMKANFIPSANEIMKISV